MPLLKRFSARARRGVFSIYTRIRGRKISRDKRAVPTPLYRRAIVLKQHADFRHVSRSEKSELITRFTARIDREKFTLCGSIPRRRSTWHGVMSYGVTLDLQVRRADRLSALASLDCPRLSERRPNCTILTLSTYPRAFDLLVYPASLIALYIPRDSSNENRRLSYLDSYT